MKKLVIIFFILLSFKAAIANIDSTVRVYDSTTIGIYKLIQPRLATRLLYGEKLFLFSEPLKEIHQDYPFETYDQVSNTKHFAYLIPETRVIGFDTGQVVVFEKVTEYELVKGEKSPSLGGMGTLCGILLVVLVILIVRTKGFEK